MSNIQKAFKTKAKRGLCMAVGGVLDPVEQNSRAIAAPVIQGNSDLIQNPTPEQPSWGGGFKSMDFDPQANLNSLSPTNPASAPNPAYGGRFGDDPHFSASTSRVIQDRNLGKPRATGSGYIPAQRNAPAPNLMTPVDQLFQERRGPSFPFSSELPPSAFRSGGRVVSNRSTWPRACSRRSRTGRGGQ